MKTTFKKETLIAAGSIIFMLMSLVGTGIFYNANKSLKKSLDMEVLNSEMILSEKLQFQKEIDGFRVKIKELMGKNKDLDKILAETTRKLNEKEEALNLIVRENGNIKSLKKQMAELTQMKKDMESQMLSLNESVQKLTKDKEMLNKTILALQDENKMLSENLAILSSVTTDNFLVEATKGKKEKLTVKANRTNKIAVSFKVPSNMVEKVSFKILKPDGILVEGNDKGIAMRIVNNETLLASRSTDLIEISKKIEMTYSPKSKLKPGIYTIEMYNGEKYIGSCNLKLR